MKPSNSLPQTTNLTVKVDHYYLGDVNRSLQKSQPLASVLAFLQARYPEQFAGVVVDMERLKDRGIRNYVDLPARRDDEFFLERVCLVTCAEVTGGRLNFSFPQVDRLISDKKVNLPNPGENKP